MLEYDCTEDEQRKKELIDEILKLGMNFKFDHHRRFDIANNLVTSDNEDEEEKNQSNSMKVIDNSDFNQKYPNFYKIVALEDLLQAIKDLE